MGSLVREFLSPNEPAADFPVCNSSLFRPLMRFLCQTTIRKPQKLRKSVMAAKHLETISVKKRYLGASVIGPLLILPFVSDLRDAFVALTLLLANDTNKITRGVLKGSF